MFERVGTGLQMVLSEEQKARAADVLKQLMGRPDAVHFLEPVDWKELGLLDYPRVIENPMDFQTIKKKMAEGRYASVEEIFDDVQLIWDNCMLYNEDTADIFKMAVKMQDTTKLEVAKVFGALKYGQKSSAYRELQAQKQELEEFDEWGNQNHLRRKKAVH